MKAKLTDPECDPCNVTFGKIYDVTLNERGDRYDLINDEGVKIDLYTWRFERLSPIEEKELDVKEAEEKLAILTKELDELKPKVGQKYLHRDGNKYILSQGFLGDPEIFALVCYEGEDAGIIYYVGYSPVEAFYGNEYYFTLIEE